MKIQPVTAENLPKALALIRKAFPKSTYEEDLVEALHANGRTLHEWIAVQTNKAVGYIGFSIAYREGAPCGWHLAPMAVSPDLQQQGIGSELVKFALRQPPLKDATIYVLGEPIYYHRFGFTHCENPVCPFDEENAHFQAIRNPEAPPFTVGYEPEFNQKNKKRQPPVKPAGASPKKRRR